MHLIESSFWISSFSSFLPWHCWGILENTLSLQRFSLFLFFSFFLSLSSSLPLSKRKEEGEKGDKGSVYQQQCQNLLIQRSEFINYSPRIISLFFFSLTSFSLSQPFFLPLSIFLPLDFLMMRKSKWSEKKKKSNSITSFQKREMRNG